MEDNAGFLSKNLERGARSGDSRIVSRDRAMWGQTIVSRILGGVGGGGGWGGGGGGFQLDLV